MSRDFKEFYEYVCTMKRMLQVARAESPKIFSEYDVFAGIEKEIRTGKYRHFLPPGRRILAEINDRRYVGQRKLLGHAPKNGRVPRS